MRADGADFRSFFAYDHMSAVAAFPDVDARLLCEYFVVFDICGEREISFLVSLFNRRNAAEFLREFVEALFVGHFREFGVHIRPFLVFAGRRRFEVFERAAYAAEFFEPKFCVFLFVVGSLVEERRYLLVALFFGFGSEIGILVARLTFAGEGIPEIGLGFTALESGRALFFRLGAANGAACWRAASDRSLSAGVGAIYQDGA